MKRILIVAVASMMAASRALAADLPVPAPAYYPVATVYNWGGGYIGINGGYGFGQSEWGNDPLNPSGNNSSGNFNVNGGLVGGTIGVSGQWGAFVLGVEGDFDWQDIRGTSSSSFCTSLITSTIPNTNVNGVITINSPSAGLSCKTESSWVGTVRARFGYAWARSLLRHRRRRRRECATFAERTAGAGQSRIRLDRRRWIGMGVRRQLDNQVRISLCRPDGERSLQSRI
jgi:opacity protein-like surface antigen